MFPPLSVRRGVILQNPKADKLLKLSVEVGGETRQIVSGIAKYYTPDQLIGKKVILVANLKPVKLRGVDSFGMILAADNNDGAVKVLFVDDEVDSGAEIH